MNAARREPRRVLADLARLDLGLLTAAAGLTVIGILLTWSATAHVSGTAFAVRGVINAVIGVGLAALIMRLDPRTLRALAPAIYLVALLALLAVLTPLGSTINGSRSWIEVPGFSIQPSEMAKVALAVALASVLADRDDPRPLGLRQLRLPLAVVAVPLALIMLQPDFGSAVVLTLLAVSALLVPGVRRRVLLGAGTALAGVVAVALFTPVLAPYQRDRLLAFVDPTADPSGIGYQVAQVKTAIGSGGLFGQGLFEGRSTQGGFIPFQYTDFVFSVAGEELGFVGAVGVVALELFVVVRMLHVARRSEDDFARLVCVALAGWFVVQTLENLGMNLGLMPVTGVPLPFVSYGGSSMFSCWAAIGLVGNIQKTRRSRLG